MRPQESAATAANTTRVPQRPGLDETHDPARRSWIAVPNGSDFPPQNLPYGAFRDGTGETRLCVALGDTVLDLRALANAGAFAELESGVTERLCAPHLGPLLEAGRPAWRAVRRRLFALVCDPHDPFVESCRAALRPRGGAPLVLALHVPDYVDFYSSLAHATNVGRIFRPAGEALTPNWRYVPIGYHGRTSTLIPSGTPVTRPRGQIKSPDAPPVYAPSRALDFELEVAFVTGNGPVSPGTIDVRRARDVIFGMLLLNDWSARDIQAWENQPLGPFLGKSFATSLGAWIVTLDALEPYRVAGPPQTPAPLLYLQTPQDEAYDIALEALLWTAERRATNRPAERLARTTFATMYWSAAQQLAHASSNGARIRAGDLFGSGTVSGSEPGSFGSLIEATWGGTRPLELCDGASRTYLEDGDEIVLRGWCETPGRARVGFGDVRGRVAPATLA